MNRVCFIFILFVAGSFAHGLANAQRFSIDTYQGVANVTAGALLGLGGCQLRVLTGERGDRAYVSSASPNVLFAQGESEWIAPLNSFLQMRSVSRDGNEEILVRFRPDQNSGVGQPIEYEYHRYQNPERAVYCKDLKYEHSNARR